MKQHIIKYAGLALILLTAGACSQDNDTAVETPKDAKSTPMTFVVNHPAQQTRATETGFETGDRIGLYVGEADTPLEIGGNLVNNEALTYNGSAWTATRTLYWDNGTFNAYAYYPYSEAVSSIEDYPFSVSTDQSAGDYETSDFLYARTLGVSASESPVQLTFRHIMSKLTIRLIKGEDFEGEMPTDAEVYIHNTVPESTIDLSAGIATVYGKGTRKTIRAHQASDFVYSAIVVPQRISNRMPLVEIIMKGVSYLYESTFLLKPGTEHLVSLIISDNPEKVKIEVGGEIQNWQ